MNFYLLECFVKKKTLFILCTQTIVIKNGTSQQFIIRINLKKKKTAIFWIGHTIRVCYKINTTE